MQRLLQRLDRRLTWTLIAPRGEDAAGCALPHPPLLQRVLQLRADVGLAPDQPEPRHSFSAAGVWHLITTDASGDIAGTVRLYVIDRQREPLEPADIARISHVEFPRHEVREQHLAALRRLFDEKAHERYFIAAGGMFTTPAWRGSGLAALLGVAAIAMARLHDSLLGVVHGGPRSVSGSVRDLRRPGPDAARRPAAGPIHVWPPRVPSSAADLRFARPGAARRIRRRPAGKAAELVDVLPGAGRMTTAWLLLGYLGLQAGFIWARYTVFRIDGPTPRGVRVVEASTLLCIASGIALIATRSAGPVVLEIAAVAAAGASAALFRWALQGVRRQQLAAAFSDERPVELLRTGAFGFVRNPFYLAYLLAHAVPLAASRSAWAWLPLAWMALLYRRAVALEERRFLASPLAPEWRRYAQVTGRFLPRLSLRRKRSGSLT